MNSFFKTFWAALLAFFVANALLTFLSFVFFAGLIAALGTSRPAVVSANSVLEIDLATPITDAPRSSAVENFDFMSMRMRPSNTILQAVTAVESAAVDSRIKGILLNIRGGDINTANLEELHNAITRFKESGKFVVSYSEHYTQGRYFLASAADSIYLSPLGSLDWQGLSGSVMFYKGLLDKLGVQAQIVRHGSFKSAVEPFMYDRMSPENRLQMQTVVDSFWDAVSGQVAASRGIDTLALKQYASSLEVYSPGRAAELGLVDGVLYADQVRGVVNSLLGNEPDGQINTVSLPGYISATSMQRGHSSANLVRIVYADGEIVDGKGEPGQVGSERLAGQLADARADQDVKAVVLRVNSPGGSALASEMIWREVELLRKEKPVVVSMGGVAASGGYYISCGADAILCDRFTLTGSIGVFGVLMNLEKGLKDKLGITVDVVRTSPSADLGSAFRSLSASENTYMMRQIEQVYTTFVGHVAEGRNLSYEAVDAIGGGRVWAGSDALRTGLADGYGGLKDAINLAADRAGVAADFSVDEAHQGGSTLDLILTGLSQARAQGELGEIFSQYKNVQGVLGGARIQARMPFILEVE